MTPRQVYEALLATHLGPQVRTLLVGVAQSPSPFNELVRLLGDDLPPPPEMDDDPDDDGPDDDPEPVGPPGGRLAFLEAFWARGLAIGLLFLLACGNGGEARPPEDARTLTTPCEIIWAKISNADIRQDREAERELKQRGKELGCLMRPASVPWGEYPEADGLPVP